MNNINTRKWSTPVIIGAGLFVTASGLMMFLGVHNPVQLAHEWIGLLFAAAILLHILNHWHSFKNYFSQRGAQAVVLSIIMVTSVFILISANQEGGGVMMSMIHSFEGSPLTEVAPLLDQSADQVVARFESAGFVVPGVESTIAEIASANGTEPRSLMGILFN